VDVPEETLSPAEAEAGVPVPAGPRVGRLLQLRADQRVRFLLTGAVNTGFGLLVFTVLELAIGEVLPYLVVLVVAHVIGVLEAFYLYRRTVFLVRGHVVRDLARFESVYLVALAVNLVLLPLLVEVGRLPVIGSQALIVVVTALISFFGHKHFSFRRPRSGS
jgi:putative flippase GtrA